jgi:hypothetical protein
MTDGMRKNGRPGDLAEEAERLAAVEAALDEVAGDLARLDLRLAHVEEQLQHVLDVLHGLSHVFQRLTAGE